MKLLVAWLVAVAFACVLAVVLGFLLHGLSPTVCAASLIGGGIGGALAFRTVPKRKPSARLAVFDLLVFPIFAIASVRAFCWVLYFENGQIKTLSLNNLGDLALHLTYIHYLANGVSFWPDNPLLTGSKLSYPVGVDLFNALLVALGMEDRTSLIVVGLLSAAAAAWALYRWGGAFTVAGFLFCGAISGFRFFQTWRIADYQGGADLKNIFLTMFMTQRGLLFAIPAGVVLLCQWRGRLAEAMPGPRGDAAHPPRWLPVLPFWIELVLYATLPLFHFHTFLFLSALLAWWFVFGAAAARAHVIKLVAFALIPATALVMLITGNFHGGSGVHIQWGWRQGSAPFFQYWGINLGLILFLAPLLCGLLVLRKKKSPPEHAEDDQLARAFVFPAVLIFLIACVVMFAPWDWDNTKIMTWSLFAVLPFLWRGLVARLHLALRVAVCFGLFFSGVISLAGGLRHNGDYVIADRAELDGVRAAVRSIPCDEWFVAAPDLHHPLQLAGRKLVLGYVGHLTSHGVSCFREEEKVAAVMLGNPGWREAALALRARYLFWGKPEREYYVNSVQPWRDSAKLVAKGNWGEIYDLDHRPERAPQK